MATNAFPQNGWVLLLGKLSLVGSTGLQYHSKPGISQAHELLEDFLNRSSMKYCLDARQTYLPRML